MTGTLTSAQATGEQEDPVISPDPPVEWRVWLPSGVQVGCHAEQQSPLAVLREVGEQWMDPGNSIPPHRHDVWELYLQLHGSSTWQIEGARVALAAGWLLAVPPGVVHGEIGRRRARHQFAYAGVDVAAVVGRHPGLEPVWRARRPRWSPGGRALAPLFRTLVEEVATGPRYTDVVVDAAVDLLVAQASRVLSAPSALRRRLTRHPAVSKARQLLDHEYADAWTVEDIAAACALSRSRFAELFTAELGQPPYDYLLERRVERACELLSSTTYSVAEVAAMVGFTSHVQLARHVRRLTGQSPTGWRARRSPPLPSLDGARRLR